MLDPLEQAAVRRAKAALSILMPERLESEVQTLRERVEQLEQRVLRHPLAKLHPPPLVRPQRDRGSEANG